jgi:hypothetical protein
MCDPVSAITIGGAVLSAGASLYEGSQAAAGEQDLVNKQQAANAQWVAYQTRIHNQQAAAEDEARQKAIGAQQDTLSKVSPQAQAQAQTSEEQRLNTLYTQPSGGQGAGQATPALSGEGSGPQSSNFMTDLTSKINQATSAARQRIAALATAGSYGGSFGGLGTTVPIAFQRGGADINLQNAIRQGNLKTYGVEQQVQPVNYILGPGTEAQAGLAKTLGGLAGSLFSAGATRAIGAAGGIGNLFGGGSGSNVATATGGGLDPGFTNAALKSFNDPIWNQWGTV